MRFKIWHGKIVCLYPLAFNSPFSYVESKNTRIMMKRLMLMGLLSISLLPAAAKAELDLDSYWFGFVVGHGITLCKLEEGGLLKPSQTQEVWLGFMKSLKDQGIMMKYPKSISSATKSIHRQGCGSTWK